MWIKKYAALVNWVPMSAELCSYNSLMSSDWINKSEMVDLSQFYTVGGIYSKFSGILASRNQY